MNYVIHKISVHSKRVIVMNVFWMIKISCVVKKRQVWGAHAIRQTMRNLKVEKFHPKTIMLEFLFFLNSCWLSSVMQYSILINLGYNQAMLIGVRMVFWVYLVLQLKFFENNAPQKFWPRHHLVSRIAKLTLI